MNGLPNHHPVLLGRNNGARSNPVAAGQDVDYPAGPNDVVLGSHYAGMGDLLLLQQLRRHQEQERHHAAVGGGSNAISQAAMFARRNEEESIRLHDGHNRMMEAELATSAMRDRIMAQQQQQQAAQKVQEDRFRTDSIERFLALQEQQRQQRELPQVVYHNHHQAAELIDQAAGHAAFAGGYYAQQQQQPLAEEMAIRESLIRRRLLEEEALKQHYQQQQKQDQSTMGILSDHSAAAAAAAAGSNIDGSAAANELDQHHLSRLLPMQQMTSGAGLHQFQSDADLVRRAAEIHAQNTALRENLEERNKRAAAAHNQQFIEQQLLINNLRFLRPEGYPSSVAVARRSGNDNQQMYLDMIDQSQVRAAVAHRTLGGDSFAHTHHQERAVSSQRHPSSYPSQPNNVNNHLRYFNNGVEVDMNGNPLPESNATPISATTTTTTNNSNIQSAMITQFLTGVVSRVPEIAPAIASLLPDDGSAILLNREFPNLVNSILGILVSIQDRVARTASDDIELDLLMRVTNCINAIKAYKVDNMNATGGSGVLPTLPATAAGNPAGKGPSPTLLPERTTMMRWDPPYKSGYPLGQMIVQPSNPMSFAPNATSWPSSAASLHEQAVLVHNKVGAFQTSPIPESIDASSDTTKLEGSADDDDIPMMAMYKATKKASKRAKKAKKWKRRPKLVHKVNTASSIGFSRRVLVHHALLGGAFDASRGAENEPPPTSHISLSPVEINSEAESIEKNPCALQTFDKENDVADGDHEIDEVKTCENKLGPHGETLDKLFGGVGTKTGIADDKNKTVTYPLSKANLAPKPSIGVDGLLISPEDSDDNASTRHVSEQSMSSGTDVHYDAASVLLGLMRK